MRDLIYKKTKELKSKNLYRRLRLLDSTDSVHAKLDGRKVLLFCTNDYLGLSRHRRVISAAEKVIRKNGVGAGAARLISGTTIRHESLEKKLARFKNKESALVFGSGFLANLGILTAFAGEGDRIVMDKLCHASLIDGARLSKAELRVFPHKNYCKCEEILAQKFPGKTLLVTESVFSMDGDLADLRKLIHLQKKYRAFFIVDDAHGTGVLGRSGHGATDGFSDGIDIIMGTLSKAIGGLGGFVAADKPLVDHLLNFARPFIFATALPPALCASAEEALHVIEKEETIRKKLWANIHRTYQGLTMAGLSVEKPQSAILPVIIGDEGKTLLASEKLLGKGIFVPAVRYPTVSRGKARLRITVSAAHSPKDIDRLIKAFSSTTGAAMAVNKTNRRQAVTKKGENNV